MTITTINKDILAYDQPPEAYHPDDIARGLRASLVAVLATALSADIANFDYLKGVLSLARSQAALYNIPWAELASSLHDLRDLGLLETLQSDGVERGVGTMADV